MQMQIVTGLSHSCNSCSCCCMQTASLYAQSAPLLAPACHLGCAWLSVLQCRRFTRRSYASSASQSSNGGRLRPMHSTWLHPHKPSTALLASTMCLYQTLRGSIQVSAVAFLSSASRNSTHTHAMAELFTAWPTSTDCLSLILECSIRGTSYGPFAFC